MSICKSYRDYYVAWIAALPIERASVLQMLDEEHEKPSDFQQNATDNNSYDWGRVFGHDIVIASLPAGGYGKANAAHCAAEMLASLPDIKFGLLVGIGAGIPSDQRDIRLGDVVVSHPNGSHGGVVQYDLHKATADGGWELKGSLDSPPPVLLKALANLQAKHESGRFRHQDFLNKAMENNKYWSNQYGYPTDKDGRLLESQHLPQGYTRFTRAFTGPAIHYGTIASGDSVFRDSIPEKIKQECLCLEMEAAGLLNKFPCIVVRGICDFADLRKNDDWQRYASATAAAFAKELLLYVPVRGIKHSQSVVKYLKSTEPLKLLTSHLVKAEHKVDDQKVNSLLRDLYTCPHTERKDRNMDALDSTCQ